MIFGRRVPLASLLFSALLLLPGAALADDSAAVVKARALFDQAVAQMDEKDFSSACPKLEQATALMPTSIGGKQALAECYEGIGRLASAWTQYMQTRSVAIGAGEPEAAKEAAAKAEELEPKLARVRIKLPQSIRGLSGLKVTLDGVVQDPVLLGTAIPVDAGKHAVEVEAPGREPWKPVPFRIADGTRRDVEVPELREIVEDRPAGMAERGGAATRTAKDSKGSMPWQRPVAYGAIGLGGASVIASVVLTVMASNTYAQSNVAPSCDARTNVCSTEGLKLREDAFVLAGGATATGALGLVFLGMGVTMAIVWSSTGAKEKRTAGASFRVDVTTQGARLQGAF